MKVVILAGGFGTRINEESYLKPKPMIEIGEKPILWHIMKMYSHYGFNDFIVCLGYKGSAIKEYFLTYHMSHSDITIDLTTNKTQIHSCKAEPWTITLKDTGLNTMTGGRIKKIQKYVGNETFMLTYGDGVADVNIDDLLSFHKKHGKLSTVTAVQPTGKFGALHLGAGDSVLSFREKPREDGGWINGGFFVLEPRIFDYIQDDKTIWERQPLEDLTGQNQLVAYKHVGFWKCMDTLRDKIELEELWQSEKAPWKVWRDEPVNVQC